MAAIFMVAGFVWLRDNSKLIESSGGASTCLCVDWLLQHDATGKAGRANIMWMYQLYNSYVAVYIVDGVARPPRRGPWQHAAYYMLPADGLPVLQRISRCKVAATQ
jgi:hypothetical protein